MADQIVKQIFNAIRGQGSGATKLYVLYPVVAGAMPVGVALPHDNNNTAGIWGAWTQILLAAAAPTVEYWYCGYQIMATGAVLIDAHAVQIGTGLIADPPTPIHNDVDPLQPLDAAAGAVDTVNFHPKRVIYPIYQPAATPISGQSAVTTKAAQQDVTTAILLATGL